MKGRRIHKFLRESRPFCGQNGYPARFPLTEDWSKVTCKSCLFAHEKELLKLNKKNKEKMQYGTTDADPKAQWEVPTWP